MHLNVQKAILDETRHIAVGVMAADVVMCSIFLLLGQFDHTVVLGALWGSLFAVGNFFFMGLGVQKAMEQADIYGHSLQREVGYLTCHSVLHLLGYDHEDNNLERIRMREKEEAVMDMLGLPASSSYIAPEE